MLSYYNMHHGLTDNYCTSACVCANFLEMPVICLFYFYLVACDYCQCVTQLSIVFPDSYGALVKLCMSVFLI